jgi:DNA-binding SARP family transcriptional activator
MRIRVLGDLEVAAGDRVVDLGGTKPRTVVGLLVAAEGRAVAVEQLIEEVWEGRPPARVEASLQTYVARLRRALDPGRGEAGRVERLRTHPGGYSLRQDDVEVDARRFTLLLGQARAAEAPRAVELLQQALAMWQGEAYAGLPSAALRAEAVRLAEIRFAAIEDLWALRTDLGGHADAVAALERLVVEQPLRERLWALLARALYRSARQGDALSALRRARDHLADELGVDPGPELQDLEQAILRQDPSLAAGSARSSPADADPPAVVLVDDRPALSAATSLFGRDLALATAGDLLGAMADSGTGRVLVVEGESGIGKTRLADELLETAHLRGLRVGRGVWESDPCPPLWAWTRALGQLGIARSALQVDAAHDAASVSFQQAEQVLAALRQVTPAVVVLDDVQWADTESLRLLRRLAPGIAEVPLLLVLLVRREPSPSAELTDAVAALTRLGAERLELSGLGVGAVRDWVRQRTGIALDDDVAARLVARTGGNPFYLGELVRLLSSEGSLAGPSAEVWSTVPPSVKDVVRQRLGALDPRASEVVTAAAVAGRGFELDVVARAVGRERAEVEEVAEALQVLGLVDEESPGRYRFTHAIARDAVYEMLSGVARTRAHAALGAALEVRHASALASHSAELARHYRLAGPGFERSAWLFAQRAAERALAQASYDEALRQCEEARALQLLDTTVTPVERESLSLATARALLRLGRPIDAWRPVAEAARCALERGDARAAAHALVTITDDIVWGWRVHPFWDDDGIALWRAVIDAAPDVGVGELALLRAGLAFELFFRPDDEALATRTAEEAIRSSRHESVPDRERMRVIQVALVALLRPEMRERRVALYDEIISIATRLEDHAVLAAMLTHRASDRAVIGRLDGWRSDVARARDLAARHHLSETMVVSGWHEALRLEMEADWEGATAFVREVEEFESTLAMSGHGIGVGHRAMILEAQGRLAELEPTLRPMRPRHPVFRELHSLAMARAGQLDELRALLGRWDDQPALPRDYLLVATDALRARTWIALGDQEGIAGLRAALAPYADELAASSGVLFMGSVHQSLGELAAAAGDQDTAEHHLRAALAVHERLALGHWAARSRASLDALGRTSGQGVGVP